ncbi:MAG: sugar phosphate isomerase/epimerase [Planctomycetota bacterium]|nr:sugar phosphate isomerase/epimerase [Planctomycetota bacterium]
MMDAFGYLETVRFRYQIMAADFWSGLLGTTDEAYARKLRQALDEKEMTVANYHVDGAVAWDPDPAKRERDHKVLEEHLRVAEILKAETVRIDFGGQSSEMSNEQCDGLVKVFRAFARRAGDNGYRIGPETHFGPALVPENMLRVLKAVDHPAYGILLHIGHWVEGREDEGDRLIAPYVMHTHIDARITATCLEEKIRLLLAAGYRGYWGVEHHSGKNEYAEVAWQLAAVRRALAKI